MNFLARPDAEALLAEDDFARLWPFFTSMGASDASRPGAGWLSEAVRQRYREVWNAGLRGGCNYYRASPLRPPTSSDDSIMTIRFPPGGRDRPCADPGDLGRRRTGLCRLGTRPGLAIVKLENETGSRLFEDREQGHHRYQMQVLKDLFLTEGTRVFKSALFKMPTEDNPMRVLVSDDQRGNVRD